MTKVVPVKMSDELYERLQQVALKVGEADSTIIRLVLRAGLHEIVKENYQLFRFSFEDAGEIGSAADAGGPSTRSTRVSPDALPEASAPPGLSESSPGYKTKSGPRPHSTRPAIKKLIEREKGKKP